MSAPPIPSEAPRAECGGREKAIPILPVVNIESFWREKCGGMHKIEPQGAGSRSQ